MLTIDGSMGEGGGQILRTSLALSLVTQEPFRIQRIRAGRKKPGLRRQHLTAIKAAQTIAKARVTGADLGSQQITFEPGAVSAGDYLFDVGTAGSTTLVLQTVLLALLLAPAESRLVLRGGTHNPAAPPFEFIHKAYLPLLARMGLQATASLLRPGFYPAGGGEIEVHIQPSRGSRRPLVLTERGAVRQIRAKAMVSALPGHIGQRELKVIGRAFDLSPEELDLVEVAQPSGPGNAVHLEVVCQHVTELFTGFGERGVPAERVASHVIDQARSYLESNGAVGPHLADQLLLPMVITGGGTFTTSTPTRHTLTNFQPIEQFCRIQVDVRPLEGERHRIDLEMRGETP
ncbi:MAG: RNA 3'-terminal phosphate cyclase [Bradymonadales bacterium]|nr:RNA 3'-terminal phosphate cyclase [Bradymonadales bacterium]